MVKLPQTRSERPPAIVRDPGIVGGEPRISGTRVPVHEVVALYQVYGDVQSVYDALTTLPPGGVEAALDYYREHRVEIDRAIEASERDAYV